MLPAFSNWQTMYRNATILFYLKIFVYDVLTGGKSWLNSATLLTKSGKASTRLSSGAFCQTMQFIIFSFLKAIQLSTETYPVMLRLIWDATRFPSYQDSRQPGCRQ